MAFHALSFFLGIQLLQFSSQGFAKHDPYPIGDLEKPYYGAAADHTENAIIANHPKLAQLRWMFDNDPEQEPVVQARLKVLNLYYHSLDTYFSVPNFSAVPNFYGQSPLYSESD